mmetsp:Transcript_93774/g.264842  ORF Transcript_93774/g.264842 Transcript_93774/m.264842 type:complete len:582 (-) Transcript_93774:1128-2873(-)
MLMGAAVRPCTSHAPPIAAHPRGRPKPRARGLPSGVHSVFGSGSARRHGSNGGSSASTIACSSAVVPRRNGPRDDSGSGMPQRNGRSRRPRGGVRGGSFDAVGKMPPMSSSTMILGESGVREPQLLESMGFEGRGEKASQTLISVGDGGSKLLASCRDEVVRSMCTLPSNSTCDVSTSSMAPPIAATRTPPQSSPAEALIWDAPEMVPMVEQPTTPQTEEPLDSRRSGHPAGPSCCGPLPLEEAPWWSSPSSGLGVLTADCAGGIPSGRWGAGGATDGARPRPSALAVACRTTAGMSRRSSRGGDPGADKPSTVATSDRTGAFGGGAAMSSFDRGEARGEANHSRFEPPKVRGDGADDAGAGEASDLAVAVAPLLPRLRSAVPRGVLGKPHFAAASFGSGLPAACAVGVRGVAEPFRFFLGVSRCKSPVGSCALDVVATKFGWGLESRKSPPRTDAECFAPRGAGGGTRPSGSGELDGDTTQRIDWRRAERGVLPAFAWTARTAAAPPPHAIVPRSLFLELAAESCDNICRISGADDRGVRTVVAGDGPSVTRSSEMPGNCCFWSAQTGAAGDDERRGAFA